MSAVRRFLEANRRASRRTRRRLRLPDDKPFWQRFERDAAALIDALPPERTVVDLGGGRRCVYARKLRSPDRPRIVAVDIAADELALNRDVAETCVADVTEGLPFPDASVDLIVSRALLEHVEDLPAAARHMRRVLAPGGRAVHFVAGRYSLFGTAARLLPFRLLRFLLHAFKPDARGETEFDVEYDHCHPRGLEREFAAAGFRDVKVETCWSQADYFDTIYPAYLLVSTYDALAGFLRWRRVATYMIVTARC